jgi:hypothetical protein
MVLFSIYIFAVKFNFTDQLKTLMKMDYRERLPHPLPPPPGAFAFEGSSSQADGQKLLQAMILQGKILLLGVYRYRYPYGLLRFLKMVKVGVLDPHS